MIHVCRNVRARLMEQRMCVCVCEREREGEGSVAVALEGEELTVHHPRVPRFLQPAEQRMCV